MGAPELGQCCKVGCHEPAVLIWDGEMWCGDCFNWMQQLKCVDKSCRHVIKAREEIR